MRMKLVAAREALAAGVGRVIVGDGRGAHPVRRALDGGGTELRLAVTEAWE
jgi:[amino group carrier protein]-L-2-aminoadipate/L-glutamate 6-kinase